MTEGAHTTGSRRLYAGAAIAAALLGVAWIAASPAPVALVGDNESLTHPLLVDAHRQLASGTLPIRTAGRWGGSALAGDAVTGALYPLYHVGYALTSFPHSRAIDVAVVLHLVVLVVGLVWWFRGLGLDATAALTSAFVAAATPTLVYASRGWIQYFAAIAWWPWLWGATARLVGRPSVSCALVGAAALALPVYAGYPQFALYGGVVGIGWLLVGRGEPWRQRAVLALAIVTGGLGIAAPALMMAIPTASVSIRSGPEGQAMLAAFDVFRVPASLWMDVVRATPLTLGQPFKLGPVVVLLALAGACQPRRDARYLAAVAIAAGVLAAGGAPFRWLHSVPPFAFFAGPVKLFYVLAVVTAGLAALGIMRLRAAAATHQRIALALLAAAIAATSIPLGAIALAAAAAPARWLRDVLAGVALAGTLAFFASTNAVGAPHLVTAGAFTPLLHEPPDAFGIDPAAGRWIALDANPRLRQVGMNFGALWDVPTWSGVGPLAPWRERAVLEDLDPAAATAIVDELGAAGVIVRAESPLATTFAQAGFRPASPHAGLLALRRTGPPPPRFALVVRAVESSNAIDAARAGRGLTDDVVVLDAPGRPLADGDPRGILDVREQSRDAARLHVRVDRPTWLVARDPAHPSWQATIDGAPVPLATAAGFLQAIEVPAGEHEVEIRYRERGLVPGVVVFAATLVTLPRLLRRLVRRPGRRAV